MNMLLDHKKVRFNYEIADTFEAGIELSGIEVKSLRMGRGSLDGAYVIIRGGETYLVNAFIPPYQENNTPRDYEPRRNRRLILTKNEIKKLSNVDEGKNLTIVPVSMYTKNNRIKVEVAVAKSKKKYDKRETIKTREVNRELRREMKRG
ncbi:MAG: SsrA-binding protein SmpB [Patescibacteria group bacterium]|nr:SsrA-binding protein SmpB [Patescibacteria group bacterium]